MEDWKRKTMNAHHLRATPRFGAKDNRVAARPPLPFTQRPFARDTRQ